MSTENNGTHSDIRNHESAAAADPASPNHISASRHNDSGATKESDQSGACKAVPVVQPTSDLLDFLCDPKLTPEIDEDTRKLPTMVREQHFSPGLLGRTKYMHDGGWSTCDQDWSELGRVGPTAPPEPDETLGRVISPEEPTFFE